MRPHALCPSFASTYSRKSNHLKNIKIEIDGIGTIEVDESFNQLSPAEQDHAIQQIASEAQAGQQEGQYSSASGQGTRTYEVSAPDGKTYEVNAPEGATQDEVLAYAQQQVGSNTSGSDVPPALPNGPPTGFENGPVSTGRWDNPVPVDIPPSNVPQQADIHRPGLVTRALAAVNEGLADGVGLPVDLANAALSKIGLGSDTPFLGSKFNREQLHKWGIGQTDDSYAPQSGTEKYGQDFARGVGGAIPTALALPAAGARLATQTAAKVTEAAPTLLASAKAALRGVVSEAGKRPGIAVASELGAGGGSNLGANVAHDAFPDSNIAPIVGSLVGGLAGGAAAARSVMKRSPSYQTDKFVAGERTNSYASFDAEVAQEVKRLHDAIPVHNAAGSKLSRAQREATLTGRLSTLEDSFLPRNAIKSAKLMPSEKAKLLDAIEKRHVLSEEDVAALRGTTEGNAVADGITKARRLRTLIPEGTPSERRATIARLVTDTALTGAGSLVAGPKGAMIARLATQAYDHIRPDPSSAEALAANAVVKQSPRYAEVLAIKGSSGADASRTELLANAAEAQDAPVLARNAAIAERAKEKAQALELEADNRRVGIENDRDNVSAGGGWRGYVQNQTGLKPKEQDVGALRMVADGKLTPQQLDAFLKSPDTLQPGNAGNAIVDRLNSMADEGVLSRVEDWTPPQPSAVLSEPSGIRNPIAYEATARGNQDRVSNALATVTAHVTMPNDVRQTLGDVIARLGRTSNAMDADALVSAARSAVPDDWRDYAASLLSPLAAQIK
jgi:hypothetical protein